MKTLLPTPPANTNEPNTSNRKKVCNFCVNDEEEQQHFYRVLGVRSGDEDGSLPPQILNAQSEQSKYRVCIYWPDINYSVEGS